MRLPKWFSHATLYRVCGLATFLFFMGFMVAVIIIANSRQYGGVGLDADDILELRQQAHKELRAEKAAERQHV